MEPLCYSCSMKSNNPERVQNIIVQSNKLIESRHTLSTLEKHIILYVISTFNSMPSYTGKQQSKCKISIHALYELQTTKMSYKDYKRKVRAALDRLYSRTLELKNPDLGSGEIIQMRWVSSKISFNKDDNLLFNMTPEAMVLLIDLKKQFTKINLSIAFQMKSFYAIRLYELAQQWLKHHTKKMLISDLRKHFDLQNKYPETKNFRVRVLEVCKQQINEYSEINIGYDLIKTGNQFTHIKFTVVNKHA